MTVVLVGAATTCGGEPQSQVPPAAKTSPSARERLAFLKGKTLFELDLETGERREVHRFPTLDVFAAPASSWTAYVSGSEVNLLDPTTGEERALGRGVAPLWSPLGNKLAYVVPEAPCTDELCAPAGTVTVYDVAAGSSEVLLDDPEWGLLGWAGDYVVAYREDEVYAVSPAGRATALGLQPSEFWAASPDGRWLVVVRGAATQLVRLDRGRVADEPIDVDTAGARLAAGGWSPDSSQLAAVALRGNRSSLVLFSPSVPELRALPGSAGATADLLWSPRGDALVFARVDPASKARLQAAYCRVAARGDCRSVLSWRLGVALLRLW